jgi:hypothetical protein
MPAHKKNLEIPHTIISLNVLATGRMILTTEKRVYELVNEVWTPMIFADDPVDEPVPEPIPVAPVEGEPAAPALWSGGERRDPNTGVLLP